ncbi:hypothetical protein VIGAN_04287300 [Vigna angularis var. angularis]|uniref:Uncharacterized protein n=1 Tax=Vigna angularis var. angularis TaxID=157739 RepID=A0A0S3RXM5_PHAAN|nr:hypothetical protein VIGAN_04287300 [Vigna angularis var. angularis]
MHIVLYFSYCNEGKPIEEINVYTANTTRQKTPSLTSYHCAAMQSRKAKYNRKSEFGCLKISQGNACLCSLGELC